MTYCQSYGAGLGGCHRMQRYPALRGELILEAAKVMSFARGAQYMLSTNRFRGPILLALADTPCACI